MNAEQVLKLIDAGFTADEIRSLSAANSGESAYLHDAPQQAAPDSTPGAAAPAAAPAEPEQVKPEPTPAEQIQSYISDSIAAAIAPLKQSLETYGLLKNMPAIESVQPKDVDDIIIGFLKE